MTVSAGTVYVDVQPQMDNFGSSVKTQSTSLFKSVGGGLSNLSKALIAVPVAGAVLGGVSSIVSTIGDWTKAAEDAQAASEKAFGVFNRDADAANLNWESLVQFAETFGDNIAVDDEDLQGLISRMTTFLDVDKLSASFGQSPNEFLETMVRLVEDTASAFDVSDTSAEKLWEGLLTNFDKGLPRVAKQLRLSQDQVDEYAKMAEKHGDIYAAQRLVLDAQKKIGGAAKEGTTESEKFSATWDNFKEWVGTKLLPAFTPVIKIARQLVILFENASDTGNWSVLAQYVDDVFAWLWPRVAWGFTVAMNTAFNSMMDSLARLADNGFIKGLFTAIPGGAALLAAAKIAPHVSNPPFPSGAFPSVPKTSTGGSTSGGDVKKFAAGGIVTRPTLALIGEAGPEAVIPLGRGGGRAELTITNWDDGTGFFRWVAQDEIGQEQTFADTRSRMGR